MTAIELRARPVQRLELRRAQVREVIVETSRVKSLRLQVDGWQGDLPGQHVDIRLTAEDGYQAQRTYSIASPPEDEFVTLTVQRVENGEVSPYLLEELRSGDQFELRGPIGGYFVWAIAIGGPLCVVAGGSGVAPLMAMLRHRDRRNSRIPAVLLYSSRNLEDVIYRKELGRALPQISSRLSGLSPHCSIGVSWWARWVADRSSGGLARGSILEARRIGSIDGGYHIDCE